MRHEPGLDLLRALAILAVMFHHLSSVGPPMPAVVEYGYVGVDLFFVLSGYLIGWQLLAPYTKGEEPGWRRFFIRRTFRVWPAYLAVLALYVFAPQLRESPGMQPAWQFLTFTQNLFPDYANARAFSHVWSLCVEEHFYLILPVLVWLLARKPTPWKIASLALAVFAGGMLLRAWIWQQDVAPFAGQGDFLIRYVEKIYNPTYARLDGLLAGVMLAVVKAFRPGWWEWALGKGPMFLLIGIAAIAAALSLPTPGFASAVIGFPLLSAGLAAVLIACVSRMKMSRWRIPGVRHVAAMAFSLYLTHKLAFHAVRAQLGHSLQDWPLLEFAVFMVAAMAAGGLLYLAVERPGLRLRDRLDQRFRHM